jgi:hypothetical protein
MRFRCPSSSSSSSSLALQPGVGFSLLHNTPPFGGSSEGFVTTILFWCGVVAPRSTPNLEDQVSIFISPGDWVAQLYSQAPSTHFSRLLRHAWATVVLFFPCSPHGEPSTLVCYKVFCLTLLVTKQLTVQNVILTRSHRTGASQQLDSRLLSESQLLQLICFFAWQRRQIPGCKILRLDAIVNLIWSTHDWNSDEPRTVLFGVGERSINSLIFACSGYEGAIFFLCRVQINIIRNRRIAVKWA